MKPEQLELLKRIENAPLISVEGDARFTKKLAAQNGWKLDKARGAIREYRRFLFLAMAAGHGVSPSDPVDQVWHLHLMYTNDYWKNFCPNVLGRPFHHHPATGAEGERNRFANQYETTLKSYKAYFGEIPPPEFWPMPLVKAGIDHHPHRRVDLEEYWVIPKVKLRGLAAMHTLWSLGACLLLVFVGVGCASLRTVSPWNLAGPDFLGFLIPLLAGAWIIAYLARRQARVPHPDRDHSVPWLHPYEMAYLAGGDRQVTQAILGKLSTARLIDIADQTRIITPIQDHHPLQMLDSLDLTFYQKINGQDVKTFQADLAPCMEPIRSRLMELGLLVSNENQKHVRRVPALIAALPIVPAAIKLYYGITLGRPVGYLVALLFVGIIVAIGFCAKTFRSRKGDSILKILQGEHERLRNELRSAEDRATPAIVCMAVALFGANVLADTPLADLQKRLGPDSSAAGCGSGCGGSGDSGSGCGGGGGCGGCGGCG